MTPFQPRYGGDEFCVALPNTTAPGARNLARKLREEIADKVFSADGEAEFHITCSIGLVPFHKDMKNSMVILKFAGRNQVKEKRQRMRIRG